MACILWFCLAALNPLLEEVLIVGIGPGSQCEGAWAQLACLCVDEERHKIVLLGQRLKLVHHLIHCKLKGGREGGGKEEEGKQRGRRSVIV